ncbi:MAG: hypothetical protein QOJ32_3410 [Frankiaceae bacterium]|nr:hypothetical protein [Frankiaceae bacterium]
MTTTDEPRPSTGEAGQGDPRRWKALAVCLVAAFMSLLDVSIVNVALPSIRDGLHATESDLQWVLSGYALAFGLVLVPAGRLGDARGRRNAFLFGLALFTVSSAVAGLAQDPTWLVAARLAQGIGGGFITPQTAGLIQQLFRTEERGRAFGLLGTTIGLSTAAGPLAGGVLIKLFGAAEGWRGVFFVNVPIGLVAIVLGFRLIPYVRRPAAERTRQDLDPVGVLLLGAGVFALLLPLVEERQWRGPGKWLLVPLALVLLAAFVGWERRYGRRGHQPVVALELFRFRSYSLGAAIAMLYFAGFTAIFFIFTLYLQSGLGYSALMAGVAVTPFAFGSAAGSAIGGRLVARAGRRLIAVGLVMVVVGFVATIVAVGLEPGRSVAWATAVPLLVAGLGSGFTISPNQAISLSEVPTSGGGSAAGVLQTGQRVGSAIGIAVVGAVFFAGLAANGGDWAAAFRRGLAVTTVFVVAALALAVLDVLAGRRAHAAKGRAAPEHRWSPAH